MVTCQVGDFGCTLKMDSGADLLLKVFLLVGVPSALNTSEPDRLTSMERV